MTSREDTGFVDKNKRKIYVGDIINNPHIFQTMYTSSNCEVIIKDGVYGIFLYVDKDEWEFRSLADAVKFGTVRGNIYDNPGLLKWELLK